MARAPKKAKADWEAIEREYRAGQLSIRLLASRHGVSECTVRKRAKAAWWPREPAKAMVKYPYGSVAKPDSGAWVFAPAKNIRTRAVEVASGVNRASTHEGEIEHCVLCMFTKCDDLCAEFGWPGVVNLHRQVHLGSARADILVAHVDGSLTLIEAKAEKMSAREYATGIGQLHHQRMLLAEWPGVRPIRMVIATTGPIPEALVSMAASSGVDIFPTPTISQWRSFMTESAERLMHGQA